MITYQEAMEELLKLQEEIKVLENKKASEKKALEKQKHIQKEMEDNLYYEQLDVQKLEKQSLSRLLAKLTGSYDDKYHKEYREYTEARVKYNDICYIVKEMEGRLQNLASEIFKLKASHKDLKEQIYRDYSEGQEAARAINEEKQRLYSQRKELLEAKEAVRAVYNLAEEACVAYDKAEGWSTVDTFFGGGLLSDLAKYSKIDEADEAVRSMNAAAHRLEKELKDVNLAFNGYIDTIDSSSRFFDIAFDNIFSDWSIRDRISGNLDELESYMSRLASLEDRLNTEIKNIDSKLKGLD
ncbi:hypothetical protein ACPWSR_00145 [Alloiococcus sp. CFN-8]|uniref:hypothetical protein n=1 Tax=Alloiococcus sp. CFN-8 TaxID=3416081 RepID=UPI003CEE762A